MKKLKIGHALLIVVLLALGVGVGVALAQDESPVQIVWSRLPEGEQGPDDVYELPGYGLVCIFDNGQLWCGCPCNGCDTTTVAGEPPDQTPPDGTEPPPPPTGVPTLEPTPTSTPVPEGNGCNQGRGNGDEGCDPGNSNNNQDSNDEPGVRGK